MNTNNTNNFRFAGHAEYIDPAKFYYIPLHPTTAPVYPIYPQPSYPVPNVCPGCGRCNQCGRK